MSYYNNYTYPPGTYPPGTYPPEMYPPGAYPPGAYPPPPPPPPYGYAPGVTETVVVNGGAAVCPPRVNETIIVTNPQPQTVIKETVVVENNRRTGPGFGTGLLAGAAVGIAMDEMMHPHYRPLPPPVFRPFGRRW